MRILGAHMGVHSRDEAADQSFFRDVLKLPMAEPTGFLIFGVPPSDIAVHESEITGHDLYLMTDDVAAFATLMKSKGVKATKPVNRGWGTLMEVTLPGGSTLGVYQPHHKRPKTAKPAKPKTSKKAAKPKRPLNITHEIKRKRRQIARALLRRKAG